jgi:hypothetical protein
MLLMCSQEQSQTSKTLRKKYSKKELLAVHKRQIKNATRQIHYEQQKLGTQGVGTPEMTPEKWMKLKMSDLLLLSEEEFSAYFTTTLQAPVSTLSNRNESSQESSL